MNTVRALGGLSSFEAARAMSSTKASASNVSYWADQMALVASKRDRDSFVRIYDHYAPRVRVYLNGLGAPAGIADELAQEALLRVWQRAKLYDPARSALSTWIFRIARNLHIDRLRSEPQWVSIQDELEQGDREDEDDTSHPDQCLDHIQLEVWINQLPAVQARLVRMSYLEAKTHREIAQELNLPLGTVKSHLRRAFQKLQLGAQGSA